MLSRYRNTSMPSNGRSGRGIAPAARTTDAVRSIVMHGTSLSVPAASTPGQRTMQGTRMPPSNSPPLAPEYGVLRAYCAPPLSLAKMTSV